jgi:hypothetical protein
MLLTAKSSSRRAQSVTGRLVGAASDPNVGRRFGPRNQFTSAFIYDSHGVVDVHRMSRWEER